MKIIHCTIDDIPTLAQLNKELYEDERNDDIPSIDILKERLQYAMEEDSEAFFFIDKDETIGYALVKTKIPPYYLSHFYICRNMRRKHLGTTVFNALMDELNCDTIDLDVFCWNQRGQGFWKSLGFEERAIIMRKHK